MAYRCVHSRASASNAARSLRYSSDASAMSPSSGFACERSSCTAVSTDPMFQLGFHDPLGGRCSTSRHMSPAESTFGW